MDVRLLALGSLLAVSSKPALAEWAFVEMTPEVLLYYDPTSISYKPDYLTVWTLSDRKEPKREVWGAYQSDLTLVAVRCSAREYGSTQRTFYSGPQGSGKVLNSVMGEPVFESAAPGTLGHALIKKACLHQTR